MGSQGGRAAGPREAQSPEEQRSRTLASGKTTCPGSVWEHLGVPWVQSSGLNADGEDTYLLRHGIPVVSQALVSQHKPVLLPLGNNKDGAVTILLLPLQWSPGSSSQVTRQRSPAGRQLAASPLPDSHPASPRGPPGERGDPNRQQCKGHWDGLHCQDPNFPSAAAPAERWTLSSTNPACNGETPREPRG